LERLRTSSDGIWRESDASAAGILYDLGVHLIDQACQLFGWPQSVYGDVRVIREGGKATDYYEVTLYYESGLKARLRSSKLACAEEPRYRIHGTNGSFVKYGLDPQEEALIRGDMPGVSAEWGQEPDSRGGHLVTDWEGLRFDGKLETIRGNYSEYYANVCRAIRGEEPLAVTPEQARNVIRIVELAIESSALGRRLDFADVCL